MLVNLTNLHCPFGLSPRDRIMSPLPPSAAMSPISKISDAAYALAQWGSEIYSQNATQSSRVLVTVLVTAAVVTVARWWFWSRRGRPPLPPGPRGLPLVGNLPFIGTELHRTFAKFAETYGPIMKLRLGSKLCIVVTSPSLAKEVFKDHDTIFANHDLMALGAATYGGVGMVWSPYGDHWRMLRKICVSEMLNHRRLEALYELRRREVRYLVSQLYSKAGSPIDAREQLFLTVFNVITSTLWGDTLRAEESRRATAEARRVTDRMLQLFAKPNVSDLFPALAWLDIQGIGRQMKKTISWFDQLLDSVINERIRREKESLQRECNDAGGRQAKDLLHVLVQQLNLKGKEGAPNTSTPGLTISHIKALLLDIMVGGSATTSITVEWALAELLKHPQKMKKAQEELEEVVGLNNMVEETHLPKLHYLNGVVKEVLRLHPAGPFLLPRCPSASCTIGGFLVPKGSKIMVNAWAIHTDPMSWDKPLEFQPERFLGLGGNKFDFTGTDFRYIPFGSGRRICVGIPLAERMVAYLLASILHSFQWKLPSGDEDELDMSDKFGLELKKATPLIAILSPRLSDLTLYN